MKEEDVQGMLWMPKAEEVAMGVVRRYLDFVFRVHVDSL
jgi:hypothetical protein